MASNLHVNVVLAVLIVGGTALNTAKTFGPERKSVCGFGYVAYEHNDPEYPDICLAYCVPAGPCLAKMAAGAMKDLEPLTRGNCSKGKDKLMEPAPLGNVGTKIQDDFDKLHGPCKGMKVRKFVRPPPTSTTLCAKNSVKYKSIGKEAGEEICTEFCLPSQACHDEAKHGHLQYKGIIPSLAGSCPDAGFTEVVGVPIDGGRSCKGMTLNKFGKSRTEEGAKPNTEEPAAPKKPMQNVPNTMKPEAPKRPTQKPNPWKHRRPMQKAPSNMKPETPKRPMQWVPPMFEPEAPDREEQTTPKTEKPEVPNTEEPAAPNTEEPAAPDTEEPATPKTEEPEVPNTEEPVAPKTEEPAAPDTEEPATPKTEEPEVPNTEEPAMPKTEEPAAPNTDEPAAPDTEEPATPKTEEPEVPNTEEPAAPNTEAPAAPHRGPGQKAPDTEEPEAPKRPRRKAPDTEEPEAPKRPRRKAPNTEEPSLPDMEEPASPNTEAPAAPHRGPRQKAPNTEEPSLPDMEELIGGEQQSAAGQNAGRTCGRDSVAYRSFAKNFNARTVCFAWCVPSGPCQGAVQIGTMSSVIGAVEEGSCKESKFPEPMRTSTVTLGLAKSAHGRVCKDIVLHQFTQAAAPVKVPHPAVGRVCKEEHYPYRSVVQHPFGETSCTLYCVPSGQCLGMVQDGTLVRKLGITAEGPCLQEDYPEAVLVNTWTLMSARGAGGSFCSTMEMRRFQTSNKVEPEHKKSEHSKQMVSTAKPGQAGEPGVDPEAGRTCGPESSPFRAVATYGRITVCSAYCVPAGECLQMAQEGGLTSLGINSEGGCTPNDYPEPLPTTNILSFLVDAAGGPHCRGMTVHKFMSPEDQLEDPEE